MPRKTPARSHSTPRPRIEDHPVAGRSAGTGGVEDDADSTSAATGTGADSSGGNTVGGTDHAVRTSCANSGDSAYTTVTLSVPPASLAAATSTSATACESPA